MIKIIKFFQVITISFLLIVSACTQNDSDLDTPTSAAADTSPTTSSQNSAGVNPQISTTSNLLLTTGSLANSNLNPPSLAEPNSKAQEPGIAKFKINPTNQYGRGAISDGADTNSESESPRIITSEANAIIIYFSRSGNVENIAKLIYNQTQADILEIEVANPYPSNYQETVNRANQERDSGNFPALSTKVPDLSQYSAVYLGSPIWAMTLSNPMIRFLEDTGELFDGKFIYPFSTHAGYGEGSLIDKIQNLAPNASIGQSFSIQDKDLFEDLDLITDWINSH